MRLAALVLALLIPPRDDFYPLEKGTRWVYQMGDLSVTQKVEGTETLDGVECTLLSMDIDSFTQKTWVSIGKEGLLFHKMQNGKSVEDLKTPALMLKLPLEKGARWETRVSSDRIDIKYAFENMGEEDVKVPAGGYRAWKVKLSGTLDKDTFEGATWYAKGVGVVKQEIVSNAGGKKSEYKIELKEFGKEKK